MESLFSCALKYEYLRKKKKVKTCFQLGVWFSNLRIFQSGIPKANTDHPESQSQPKALLGSSYKMSWELLPFNTD